MFVSLLSVGLALLPLASATVIDVQVGQTGLTFTPEAVLAQPGDQVVFHYHAKNHSVTQSSFASPCGKKDGGVDSGFMPVAANATDFPTFTFNVTNTNATWFYCAQAAGTAASHCGAGMVFAVNCGANGTANSFTNFKASALAIGASLSAAAGAATPAAGGAATTTYTAAYGGVTVPPPPVGADVTETITLDSSTWATTYTSYPNSPAATPAALTGNVHKVTVGANGQLLYDPQHISAQPRDVVVFEFHQKNHTATQSSFADPCRKLNSNGVTGFDSGFQPVADGATTFPTWNFTVVDTSPIWVYCRQQNPSSHCGAGMVFAINSDESSPRNYSAFVSLAKQLNGTGAALANPTSNGVAALGVRFGGVALSLVLGAAAAVLL